MYPIALFVYKRPELTRKTLEALSANPEFSASRVFIYSDGARSACDVDCVRQTREVIRSMALTNATIIERDHNFGLAASITSGVTELCDRYGGVIVVEDDLLVSRSFLNFMNSALAAYEDDPRIMEVGGHSFVDCERVHGVNPSEAVVLPFATSWGWATWQRAWKHYDASMSHMSRLEESWRLRRRFDVDGSYPFFRMLKRAAKGKIDSWAIFWYLSIFVHEGLTVYPPKTLVQHLGHDGAGSNVRRISRTRGSRAPANFAVVNLPRDPFVDPRIFAAAKRALKRTAPIRVWLW